MTRIPTTREDLYAYRIDGQRGPVDVHAFASRLRALTHVDRYVVVGAPEAANTMIETSGKLLPVEAHTFPLDELDQAPGAVEVNEPAIS